MDFAVDLKALGADPGAARHVCMDMGAAYAKGAAQALPTAGVSDDRSHVIALAEYMAFKRWAAAGRLEATQERLRQQWRRREGPSPEPTAAVIESQSTRSTPTGGNSGLDAGKKVKGRKRGLVVDSRGLLLTVTMTAASVQDRDTTADVEAKAHAKASAIKKLYAADATDADAGQRSSRPAGSWQHRGGGGMRRLGHRATGTWLDAQQALWPREPAKAFVVQPMR